MDNAPAYRGAVVGGLWKMKNYQLILSCWIQYRIRPRPSCMSCNTNAAFLIGQKLHNSDVLWWSIRYPYFPGYPNSSSRRSSSYQLLEMCRLKQPVFHFLPRCINYQDIEWGHIGCLRPRLTHQCWVLVMGVDTLCGLAKERWVITPVSVLKLTLFVLVWAC